MANAAFQMQEVFSAGWEGFKKNWVLLICLLILSFFVTLLISTVLGSLPGIITAIINAAAGSYIMLSTVKAVLMILNGETPGFNVLKNDLNLYIKFFVVSIILSIIFMIATFLLVIPVLFALAIFFPVQYMLVDKKDMPIADLFKRSAQITVHQLVPCLILVIVSIILALISVIPLGLGLLISVPVIYIAGATAYKKLDAATENTTSSASMSI